MFTNTDGPVTFSFDTDVKLCRALLVDGGAGGRDCGGGGGAGGYVELDWQERPRALPDGTPSGS